MTALKVVTSPGLANLSARSYSLNNTPFSYALTTVQTPSCGYSSSSWAVSSSGANSAAAPNFAVINSATGVYGFAGMNQENRVGSYTIAITSVTVNGVTFT